MHVLKLMFSNENRRWAGGDLGPLPHESSLTVFWRFCWRNALDPGEMNEHFGASGHRVDWVQFEHATGWGCPDATELRTQGIPSRELLFHGRLRYCPICMECGYHSVWYQFRGLGICLLHGVRLISDCFHCGEPTAPLSDYVSCL